MSAAERIESLLRQGGVPPKSVWAGGASVIVTCWSEDSASKAAGFLRAAGFDVGSVVASIDHDKANKGTCLNPSSHRVYRVGGRVAS